MTDFFLPAIHPAGRSAPARHAVQPAAGGGSAADAAVICRVCLRPMPANAKNAGAARGRCRYCDEKFARAEALGERAGREERHALGLDGPQHPHYVFLARRRPVPYPAPLRPTRIGRVPAGHGWDGGSDFDPAPRRQPWRAAGLAVLLCLTLARGASAGTLTGKFTLPNSALPAAHATLTLRLSQAGIVPGSSALVPSPVVCYTTANGAVTGLPDPLAAPAVTASQGNGSLPAGAYFVEVTTYNSTGESLPSPEAAAVLPAPGALSVEPPPLPAGASYAVYIGTSSGEETRQAIAGAGPYLQSVPLAAGVPPPSANTSPCQFTFNDAIVPAPTYYIATLTDASGNTYAGFPQDWYLTGTTADVSQIYPLATPLPIRFLTPIFANPATGAAQSLNSSLNLNGYSLDNSANVGPGTVSEFWSGSLPAPSAALVQWTPNAAVVLRRLSVYAQTAGEGGSAGAVFTVSNVQGTCTFPALLAGAGNAGSSAAGSGVCAFSAGLPLTLSLSSDDHATRPGNVNFVLEFTAQ